MYDGLKALLLTSSRSLKSVPPKYWPKKYKWQESGGARLENRSITRTAPAPEYSSGERMLRRMSNMCVVHGHQKPCLPPQYASTSTLMFVVRRCPLVAKKAGCPVLAVHQLKNCCGSTILLVFSFVLSRYKKYLYFFIVHFDEVATGATKNYCVRGREKAPGDGTAPLPPENTHQNQTNIGGDKKKMLRSTSSN